MSSGSPKEGKPAPAVVPPKASAPTAPATAAAPAPKTLTSLQKTQLGSKFTDSTAERRRDNLRAAKLLAGIGAGAMALGRLSAMG